MSKLRSLAAWLLACAVLAAWLSRLATNFYLTNAVVLAMMGGGTPQTFATSIDAGTAAVINIYDGTPPANADAALSGNTLLAQLVCSATAAAYATNGINARATFNAITSDASADATGTATFFRILTQSGGTVIGQGTVGTSAADLILNTVSITAGSTVSITSAVIDLPRGAN
jgi:hypothetical protein